MASMLLPAVSIVELISNMGSYSYVTKSGRELNVSHMQSTRRYFMKFNSKFTSQPGRRKNENFIINYGKIFIGHVNCVQENLCWFICI